MSVGDHPDAKAVFDLAPNEVVALARTIREEERRERERRSRIRAS